MKVSDTTKRAVWEKLGDMTRLVRYYEKMAKNYECNHIWIRIGLIFFASASVASLFDLLPVDHAKFASGIAGLLVALLVAVDFAFDYGKKAIILHTVRADCGLIENEWKALWDDIQRNKIEDDEVHAKNKLLADKLEHVLSRADYAGIVDDEELNRKIGEQVPELMENEYGTETR